MSVASARAWRLAGAVCGFVVALDQGTKALVETNLVPGQEVQVLGPLSLTLAHNRGVAFGLASGGGWALIGIVVAALVLVCVLFAREPTRPGMWLAVGLLAGGAVGNLADRIRADAVTDFVVVSSWPPFNLADASITLGVALLALSYVREQSP
ncbi:MAG: signal peptidase II [Solirubrobacterales bacterium]